MDIKLVEKLQKVSLLESWQSLNKELNRITNDPEGIFAGDLINTINGASLSDWEGFCWACEDLDILKQMRDNLFHNPAVEGNHLYPDRAEVIQQVIRRKELGESRLNEEDLFPQASTEEVERRNREKEQKLLKRVEGFKLKDRVMCRDENPFQSSFKGREGEIDRIQLKNGEHLLEYPIRVKFTDLELPNGYELSWFAPEELEKVS